MLQQQLLSHIAQLSHLSFLRWSLVTSTALLYHFFAFLTLASPRAQLRACLHNGHNVSRTTNGGETTETRDNDWSIDTKSNKGRTHRVAKRGDVAVPCLLEHIP